MGRGRRCGGVCGGVAARRGEDATWDHCRGYTCSLRENMLPKMSRIKPNLGSNAICTVETEGDHSLALA